MCWITIRVVGVQNSEEISADAPMGFNVDTWDSNLISAFEKLRLHKAIVLHCSMTLTQLLTRFCTSLNEKVDAINVYGSSKYPKSICK